MKRLIALLMSACLVLALAACAVPVQPEQPPAVQQPEPMPVPSVEQTPVSEPGQVRFVCVSSGADMSWNRLAKAYTDRTGVEVTVEALPEEGYADALGQLLGSGNGPTLFDLTGAEDLTAFGEHTLDLRGTALHSEITADDFLLTDETGALKAVGYSFETFGILVNTALLEKAGYLMEDITGFDALRRICEDIHLRAEELGFDAFVPTSLDITMSHQYTAYMANMPLYFEFRDGGITAMPEQITGRYLDGFRNLWDLQVNNCSADPAALKSVTNEQVRSAFYKNEAVFWLQGSWELAGCEENRMNPAALSAIPIYTGTAGESDIGLCSEANRFWAVNPHAGAADIQATLDFLYWLVTSEEGTDLLAEHFGSVPLRMAQPSRNPFCVRAEELTKQGRTSVDWVYPMTPQPAQWRAGVADALAAYAASPGDESWAAVETAFVDGWAQQYAALQQPAP